VLGRLSRFARPCSVPDVVPGVRVEVRVFPVLVSLFACGAESPPPVPPPSPPPAAAIAQPPPASAVGADLDLTTLPVDHWYRPYTPDAKLSVVVFWELWCPHCKREVPKLTGLDGIDGVQVIGLTRQTKGVADADLEAFLAANGVDYAVGHVDGALSQRLQIRSIPAAVVVQDGKILWQGNPAALTETQLRGWM
jgi:thiol-disulfide isomerase/thioredoxin